MVSRLFIAGLLHHQTISRHLSTISTPSLNFLLNDALNNRQIDTARLLFDEHPTTRDVVSWNTMISGYLKNKQVHIAQQLFDEMPTRDIVSWNVLLSGFHNSKKSPNQIFQLYLHLRRSGLQPSGHTFSIVITAVLGTVFNVLIPQLHARLLCNGHNASVFVGTALVRGYTDLCDYSALCQVFNEVHPKTVATWNALILGFTELGLMDEADKAFSMMPEKNVISWTTMVDGYLRTNQVARAREVFDRMSDKNVVSWTTMLSGYVQLGMFSDALRLFVSMMKSKRTVRPNEFTFSSVFDACAGSSDILTGKQIHACIIKLGIPTDIVLSTALTDMYAKCGDIEASYSIFELMPNKSVESCNSMIGGYARHGLARRALEEYDRMVEYGLTPDHITFVSVLSACAHGGLVELGERLFASLPTKYGLRPSMEHYACMVDLYGKSGDLEKAEGLISGMPFEPDVVVWGALLGACGLYSDIRIGEYAAKAVNRLQKDHPAMYAMITKILGEKGLWDTVIQMRDGMKERRATTRQKAGSWVA